MTNSSEAAVVYALERFVNITKGPVSAKETLTDGEITTITKSLVKVTNLLNIGNHLVSDTIVEVRFYSLGTFCDALYL